MTDEVEMRGKVKVLKVNVLLDELSKDIYQYNQTN
jgi:hypothetical protein